MIDEGGAFDGRGSLIGLYHSRRSLQLYLCFPAVSRSLRYLHSAFLAEFDHLEFDSLSLNHGR